MDTLRADLYAALAEALAEPPDWLALPGSQWPLYEAAARLAQQSPAARRAAAALEPVMGESLAGRRDRYAALFGNAAISPLWLYESGLLTGRLLGQPMLDVERWYKAAGLETTGAELADYVSLELDFLAHLAGQPNDNGRDLERAFIHQHAGRWMPALARALFASGDPIYAPVGRLLVEWLEESARPPARPAARVRPVMVRPAQAKRLPAVAAPDECTLCGFCMPACPANALAVHEDERTTRLVLAAERCISCGKCTRACQTGTLRMAAPPAAAESGWSILRESPRATCLGCGTPLVSQAELNYVAEKLGNPAWLPYCTSCRASF